MFPELGKMGKVEESFFPPFFLPSFYFFVGVKLSLEHNVYNVWETFEWRC